MKRLRLRGMRLAYAVFATQVFVGMIAAGGWTLGQGADSGLAPLYGIVIAVVPGFFFALRLLWQPAGASPRHIARSLYIGEFGKLALTICLFYGGVVWFGANFLPLLSTFAVCLACYLLVMAVNR